MAKGAGPARARTWPAVDILKAIQQRAAPVRLDVNWAVLDGGYTLTQPGESD